MTLTMALTMALSMARTMTLTMALLIVAANAQHLIDTHQLRKLWVELLASLKQKWQDTSRDVEAAGYSAFFKIVLLIDLVFLIS